MPRGPKRSRQGGKKTKPTGGDAPLGYPSPQPIASYREQGWASGEIPHVGEPEAPTPVSTTRRGKIPDRVDVTQGFEGGWSSRGPIEVGIPIQKFEPKATDPKYQVAQFRPDTIVDGWSTDRFAVRGASLRGYWHRYEGSPRQDDFTFLYQPEANRLIVTIADGVSGALHSHVGATTATRYASEWLARSLTDDVAATDWKALTESTAWALVEQARRISGDDEIGPNEAERLVATTLICAVIDCPPGSSNLIVHAIGIGDSGGWKVAADGFDNFLGGKHAADGGISSSAVRGLPQVPLEVLACTITVEPGEVVLFGSDGFGDPLGDGSGEVGSLFKFLLGREILPSGLEFAHALDFSRETFDDDRTLVAVWPRASESPLAPS